MESAPQSTITHNAVIEFASDLFLFPPHACHRGSGGRIKKRPTLPKRAASNRAGPCQNRIPGATLRKAQTVDFSRVFVPKRALFARILENPRNGYRTGAAALS